METKKLIPLEQAVFSVMNETREFTSDNFEYYLQLAIEGYRSINIFDQNILKVVHLQPTQNGVIELPCDYISYRKIGVLMNGQVWTLTLNNDLSLPRHECCNQVQGEQMFQDNRFAYYYAPHYYNGAYLDGMYSMGGGVNISYYRIDEEMNQLVISPNIMYKEIILEYKSTGISMDSKTMLPVTSLEAVKSYVHWKRLEYDSKVPYNDKARKQQLYDEEVIKLRNLENKFTKEEFLDMFYSTTYQGVKR